jgi:hypothetical protein
LSCITYGVHERATRQPLNEKSFNECQTLFGLNSKWRLRTSQAAFILNVPYFTALCICLMVVAVPMSDASMRT